MTLPPPEVRSVFARLAAASRKGAPALVGFYLAENAQIEDAWSFAPGLKAEIRLGGTRYPTDLLRLAAVVFDAVGAYTYLGGPQRVEWLTREGLARSLGRGALSIEIPGEEADRCLSDPREPLLRIGVALRDDPETRSLLVALTPTAERGRLWLRPRRVVLVNGALDAARDASWRLRDVESDSLREVWTPLLRPSNNPPLPVRFGPVSARETEIFRLNVPFVAQASFSAIDPLIEPVLEQLSRSRTALELALGEVRREGVLSPRLLDDLLRVEWDRWNEALVEVVESADGRAAEARLAMATVAFVAARPARAGHTSCVLRKGRGVGREAEVDYEVVAEERPFQFLWRCWGVQNLTASTSGSGRQYRLPPADGRSLKPSSGTTSQRSS
jgi:hypothetical protein